MDSEQALLAQFSLGATGVHAQHFEDRLKDCIGFPYSQTFGLNRIAFHYFSLILLALDAIWLGVCVRKAFPENQGLAIYTSFFSFVLPTIAPLSYLIHTDNSRVAILFSRLCVYLFQRWVDTPKSWIRLIPPVVAYCVGSLTYECATFLIFTVPLWVWPVHLCSRSAS